MAANSTMQEEVYRSDGIRLYGLDAELELKMQSKRDKTYESELAKWIEQVVKEKMEFDDIAESLKTGVVLCKLLNAIQPGTVKSINLKPIALMQVENIQLYLKGCWHLGVPTSDLFVTSDLFQKKDIPQVLQNIVSLARVAQTIPEYKGPKFGVKLAAPVPVKKWAAVETNQVVYAADLQAKAAGIQANVCMECGTPKKHLAKTCDKCGADFNKQNNIDVAQVIANLKTTKQQLEQLQAKFQKVEEENKIFGQLQSKSQKIEEENKKSDQLRSKLQKLEAENKKLEHMHEENKKLELLRDENKRLELLQSKFQKVEEENKRLVEQLKQVAKDNEKPTPTKPEPTKTEPTKPYTPSYVKQEPKPASTKPEPTKTEIKPGVAKTAGKFGQVSYVPAPNAAPYRNFKIPAKTTQSTPTTTTNTSTTSSSTTTPKASTTYSTPTPSSTTTPRATTPPRSTTPSKPEAKPIETKVEAQVAKETPASSNPQRGSGFGPRDLKALGANADVSDTSDSSKSAKNTDPSKVDFDKRKLEMENARLAKDNAKLTADYQGVERKYREEANKIKEMDDKLRIMERKLEAAGLQSYGKERPVKATQMATIRYRPSLRNRTVRNLNGMASDLHKRLNTPLAESLDSLEFDIDPDMIRYAKDCMVQILFSKPIDFADVYALNDLFGTDSGRRCFIQIMQATMKEIPTLVVSDNSFELLLYLINTVLQEMDVSDTKDLIAAKVLMNCACSLSRKSGDTFQFFREFIHSYALWKDPNFWEEYFWDTLAKKHRRKYGETITGVDKELTVGLIASFAYNMLNWGVSKEMAKTFSYEMAGRNNISTHDIAHVEDVIANFQGTEAKSKIAETVSQHKFHDKFFVRPTFCHHCHQLIWGLASKQGYKCGECKCKIHKKCLKDAEASLPCNTVFRDV